MKKCPTCGKPMLRVIYYGLPHYLCEDEYCNTVCGFWNNITVWLPFNGNFFVYEGNYFKGLFQWLFYVGP